MFSYTLPKFSQQFLIAHYILICSRSVLFNGLAHLEVRCWLSQKRVNCFGVLGRRYGLAYHCSMELQNDLLLRVLKGEQVPRPPVWLMRQAGRILPEYRALRAEAGSFINLVRRPEWAAEATLQPVEALEVDAAIIFSDILVVPEAMGLPYELIEQHGPRFPKTIRSEADVRALIFGDEAAQRLSYVYEALQLVRQRLAGRVPLIGFCGAPWTLFCYMVEGQGSKTFSKAKAMLYRQPELAHELLQRITHTNIAYLRRQVAAGAQVLQLFDSWAGALAPQTYQEFAVPYIAQIVDTLRGEVPLIVFAKGAWFALAQLANTRPHALGLDWTVTPAFARTQVGPKIALQGNLDPCALYAQPEQVVRATREMLRHFGIRHIANLGHGVYPDTPLEGVYAFIETVKVWRYSHHT